MSKEINGKKKVTNSVTYLKWTEVANNNEVIDVIKKSNAVYILKQTIYNDETQSMTIEIHFKP